MVATANPILEKYGLDKLNDDEKRSIVTALLASVTKSDGETLEVPEWHWDIIKERIAEADANPGNCISLSELRKKWAAGK